MRYGDRNRETDGMNIKDCAAIVTGGASGLGKATAQMLAEAGARAEMSTACPVAAESLRRAPVTQCFVAVTWAAAIKACMLSSARP